MTPGMSRFSLFVVQEAPKGRLRPAGNKDSPRSVHKKIPYFVERSDVVFALLVMWALSWEGVHFPTIFVALLTSSILLSVIEARFELTTSWSHGRGSYQLRHCERSVYPLQALMEAIPSVRYSPHPFVKLSVARTSQSQHQLDLVLNAMHSEG